MTIRDKLLKWLFDVGIIVYVETNKYNFGQPEDVYVEYKQDGDGTFGKLYTYICEDGDKLMVDEHTHQLICSVESGILSQFNCPPDEKRLN